ncbi:glycine--tRNA ligase subunit beta [Pseudoxanthomonas winnipegensis]|jgi:glycyl-tRNA synthetase beta chain|uniref:Glycine--tRNA ligase beta subunit n=1 Tax=Pseudoxanthomonas winnipegensis TaxID=2480810 RepID=A0ABY1WJI1_9GAMM|nr:glycine--tRNA ligase subunit beta [Pseudoxanthomonas winnipegensis]TAA09782.1 glycine--tRNA ligase subunit beta [Pseudoxanthomonas winnipegensis]TAA22838.1 glycine--tRNA ligase subunit beta [Pseudoxanthomonas winnipegensis]TAH73250.1 glycine--tRNA ligase subunit beta [Pseudoxanthomonas winnipegensis]
MSEQLPLLIELGTEELPVKALPGLADALFDGIKAGLEKRGVAVDAREARPLFTPRRLAVLLPGVAVEQPEQASEVFGPYVNIALDADGQPTKALSGFAAKAGVDWTQLERTTDAKGERFVLRATRAGARTADLLPEVIAEAVAAMPIPKPMRWGDHDYAFARPVQWLVALLGEQVIDTTLMGVAAGRESRGHRFEHDAPVSIAAPGDYVAALEAARVLVDPQQRRARIIEQVQAAARSVDGDARVTDDNLEQVVCLTEWPNAVACSFEPAFLAVPQEALIETMEINQKFFPVLRDGVLTEHFIGIANIASRDPAQVRAGYERVIRPRFADAKFFFDEDLKQGLVAMGEGLATVTYQAKLGTVADKVARVAALAQAIAPQVGADAALARRAAELSKNDLQSRMVGEFPELQGIAGRHYALAAGEPQEVALAIDEGYQPRFAGDDIALSPLGKVLAIAERLDTLAGGFAAGLKPTGNKDPFALRRNALGLARTIIESGFDLDLTKLIQEAKLGAWAYSEMKASDEARGAFLSAIAKMASLGRDVSELDYEDAVPLSVAKFQEIRSHSEIYDFILDRLKGYYADKGVPTTQFNAVAELKPASLYDFDRRIEAIGTFAALPEAAALAAANKRIGNILKKAQAEGVQIPDHLDRGLIEHPAEAALAEAVQAAIGDTDTALHQHDYVAVLARLALLREQVDSFFDMVMVNAENPAVRGNRLALLHRLHARFGKVADIAQLSA